MKNNGWKSYLCLEIVEKNECTVKFQNFLGAMPPDPTPFGTPALRASVPRLGPSAPPSSLSVCS